MYHIAHDSTYLHVFRLFFFPDRSVSHLVIQSSVCPSICPSIRPSVDSFIKYFVHSFSCPKQAFTSKTITCNSLIAAFYYQCQFIFSYCWSGYSQIQRSEKERYAFSLYLYILIYMYFPFSSLYCKGIWSMSNYLPLDLVLIFIMCFFVLLGYVRLQTSHGDLNLELHCEMVRKSKSLKFEIFFYRIGNNNIYTCIWIVFSKAFETPYKQS